MGTGSVKPNAQQEASTGFCWRTVFVEQRFHGRPHIRTTLPGSAFEERVIAERIFWRALLRSAGPNNLYFVNKSKNTPESPALLSPFCEKTT